eukprot:gene14108-18929_t
MKLLIILLIIEIHFPIIFVTGWWHAYNSTKAHSVDQKSIGSYENSLCGSFEEETKPYSLEFMEKLDLWPGLMSQFDLQHGETIYGSKSGLDMIYRNQNPENCSTAKYIISGGWPYGFGSRIHTEGSVLALAMQLGRVFLLHPDGDNVFWEDKNPFCRGGKGVGLACYYTAVSKCTITDALFSLHGDVNSLPSVSMGDFQPAFDSSEGRLQIIEKYAAVKSFNIILTYGNLRWNTHSFVPFQMIPLIKCSPMRDDNMYYWWRAVSATYLIRPNKRTLDFLTTFMNLPSHDLHQCIAMFVRHGDKGIEMQLLQFSDYRIVAEGLWSNGLLPASKKLKYMNNNMDYSHKNDDHANQFNLTLSNSMVLSSNGSFFITTEDPAVLKEADEWGKANNWKILYTNLFHREDLTAYYTWAEQHERGKANKHDDLEYTSMLLNLYYSLRCEAWVCTMASNSCRVIDELRATIGAKANRVYADISKETCPTPPCLGSGIVNFFD